jgi:NitT/TauT family transport system substrate-binding protein
MTLRIFVFLGALLATISSAVSAEKLKVAVPQRGFWDSMPVEFAVKQGFFKKYGLDVEIFWTSGGSETLQVVMTGSADIAMSNGFLGVVSAYAKGAPIRVIGAEMTGVHDVYWYVKKDSPIKTLKDADGKSIAFSRPGSSTNLIVLNLLKDTGSKAKPVSTGGLPATKTQVMSGQIDIGWAVPPFGVKELNADEIRILVKGSEAKALQDVTIRVDVANLNSLKTKREAITNFMKAVSESINWMYSDPKALELYAAEAKVSLDVAKRTVAEFYPKSALQIGEIRGFQATLDQAFAYKRLPEKKTAKDMQGLIDIVYNPNKK